MKRFKADLPADVSFSNALEGVHSSGMVHTSPRRLLCALSRANSFNVRCSAWSTVKVKKVFETLSNVCLRKCSHREDKKTVSAVRFHAFSPNVVSVHFSC